MTIRLLTFLLFATGGIGFEYDPGTGVDVSRYQHTRIVVSEGETPYRVELQYMHTYQTSFTLSVRIHNAMYSNALLYTQTFNSPRTVTRAFDVATSMVHQPTQWLFVSQSNLGTKQWTLTTQPRVLEQVTSSTFSSWESAYGQEEINEFGIVVTRKEMLSFNGFSPRHTHGEYGRLDLTTVSFEWLSKPVEWNQYIQAYLLIAYDTALEDLSYWDEAWQSIPLHLRLDQNLIYFEFPTLFVHPSTLRMSETPIEGYRETSQFYFPIDEFQRFKETTLQLHLHLNYLSNLHLTYTFVYEMLTPLVGPCSISQFCVRIPYA